MAKLNKNKPYGEVCGGLQNYKYEQDRKHFNHNGDEVDETGKVVEPPAKKAKPKKAEPKAGE